MENFRLQACKGCRGRKVKCDKTVPRCSGCQKSDTICVFVDPATDEEHTRESIAALEAKERELRRALQDASYLSHNEFQVASDQNDFVGEASGVSFLERMFVDPRWSRLKARLVEALVQKSQIQEPETPPATFPSSELALLCIETYLNESHIQKPFLLKRDVFDVYNRIYSSEANPSTATGRDRYRLLMICAIAAVTLQRRKFAIQHPYSFFLAAQIHCPTTELLSGLGSIQDLLLIARFSIYFHTGTSIWEISRICMSICVEMELHLTPLLPIDALREQLGRRIFWECYLLDRYCSTTLGRPFAIADQDIEVSLPVIRPDEEIALCQPGQLDDLSLRLPVQSSEHSDCMEVFVLYVKLRQITSCVHDAFYSAGLKSTSKSSTPGHRIDNVGQTYTKLHTLVNELEQWRASAPIFPQAHSMYQREQWYDFLLEKERLSLIRGAMNVLPMHQGSQHRNLISLCQDTATRVIELYSDMLSKRQINVTRGYFQMLFSSGLLLVYCLSSDSSEAPASVGESTVLLTLGQVLWKMSETMIDARRYAVMFDFIKDNVFSGASTGDYDVERQISAVGSGMNRQNAMFDGHSTTHAGTAPVDSPINMQPSNEFWDMPSAPYFSDPQMSQIWFMEDWNPFMSQFMASMESEVNRFACDGFPIDTITEMGQGSARLEDQVQAGHWNIDG